MSHLLRLRCLKVVSRKLDYRNLHSRSPLRMRAMSAEAEAPQKVTYASPIEERKYNAVCIMKVDYNALILSPVS